MVCNTFLEKFEVKLGMSAGAIYPQNVLLTKLTKIKEEKKRAVACGKHPIRIGWIVHGKEVLMHAKHSV